MSIWLQILYASDISVVRARQVLENIILNLILAFTSRVRGEMNPVYTGIYLNLWLRVRTPYPTLHSVPLLEITNNQCYLRGYCIPDQSY